MCCLWLSWDWEFVPASIRMPGNRLRGMRRPVSTPRGLKAPQVAEVAVSSRLVGHSIVPAAPEDPDPSTSQSADRMRVVLTSGPGSPVDLLSPRVPVAGGVGKGRDGDAEALVAGPPEGRDAQLARLHRDRAHAGGGGKRGLRRVALPAITALGGHGRGAGD